MTEIEPTFSKEELDDYAGLYKTHVNPPVLDYRVARLVEQFPIPPGTNGVLLRERGAIWVKMVAYNKIRPGYVKVKFWMAVKKCWSGGQKEVPTRDVRGMGIGQ